MTPIVCQIKHDPPRSYGDCLRACVASLLDLDPPAVPHFASDDPSSETLVFRIETFLRDYKLIPMWTMFEGSKDDVLGFMGEINPRVLYLLFNGAHVVVCKGGTIEHDPAWSANPMNEPTDGVWKVMVLCSI